MPVAFDWGYFPNTAPAFPRELTDTLIAEAGLPGILADKHASGTAVIDETGAEHYADRNRRSSAPPSTACCRSRRTKRRSGSSASTRSAGSRPLCDRYRIGRVIARPFVGSAAEGFRRTETARISRRRPRRHDPRHPGKAGRRGRHGRQDRRHLRPPRHRPGDQAARERARLTAAIDALRTLPDGGFVFANLVDFDTEFGHRRDIPGYAAALEAFDGRVPEIAAVLREGDLAVITADHGNDPSWRCTDHTREHAPILVFGPGVTPGSIGRRESLADIGATIADHLDVPSPGAGRSWLKR